MPQNDPKLDLFGIIEDGSADRMVCRVLGHRIGESSGWFHWNGLAVVLPEFEPSVPFLVENRPAGDRSETHLAIDFYSGEGHFIRRGEEGTVVTGSFTLSDLLQSMLP